MHWNEDTRLRYLLYPYVTFVEESTCYRLLTKLAAGPFRRMTPMFAADKVDYA
jgi:hypothetical protein